MKIALLTNHNSYVGREYADKMISANIDFDIIAIGNYPNINELEEERCGGLWRPIPFQDLVKKRKCYYFDKITNPQAASFVKENNYDLGIQGGTGIIKDGLIKSFKLAILNFHPGNLPDYRGCSAPEWQLYEENPIVSTCHIIDNGIDTGAIYKKKILNIEQKSYFFVRSKIYPATSIFVVEVINEIINISKKQFIALLQDQDNTKAKYREYIGEEKINFLKEKLSG